MKKIILISLVAILTVNLSAQDEKGARKSLRAGNKAFSEQLYGTAEGKYAEAAAADPASKVASYNLATTYYKQQRWDDALKEYQRYLSLEKEDPKKMSSAWSSVGNVYLRKKGDEASQRRAQQTTQMQNGQAQQQTGGQQADNLKMSIEAYKNSLRLNPQDNDTRYNLAVAQKMLKDQQQDQNQDKDKDKKDDKKDQDKKDDQQNQDKKQDPKQNQNQNQNQMSQDNMQQILEALEQEEKQTQERVQKMKEQQRQRQNADNKRQNKDW